jgi:membrane associated rhomboid family serine protease
VILIYWVVLQLASGLLSAPGAATGGVAVWAHVGGFLAGIILIKLFERPNHVAARRAQTWRPSRKVLWG